jgi:hypothetical protein
MDVSTSDGPLDEAEGTTEDAESDKSWYLGTSGTPLEREWRRLQGLVDAQRRGYSFQDFVGGLFKRRHFKVDSSPATARPRQTDLLATRGNDAYLIETKWRKSKANINDVDSLFSRLDAVPHAVIGVLVSHSGFTASAVERVEQRSERPVLLIAGEELEQVVRWDEDITRVLSRKKALLLVHRKAFTLPSRRSHSVGSPSSGELLTASAKFVFPNGAGADQVFGLGTFGQFTFAQELPDIDWDAGEGYGVTLDMRIPVYDQDGIISLLRHLSSMGWTTQDASWSIQQSTINWFGFGSREFARAIVNWGNRYRGISTHHSEEFCYFDKCDGGFYCLTAKISADESRAVTYIMLSFQLAGIPLETESFKELARIFDVNHSLYFRQMERKSLLKALNPPDAYRLPLEPVAFIVENDNIFGDTRDWVRGIVARNPFYSPNSTLAERQPDWLPEYTFDSELMICGLRSWHLLEDPKLRYELWGCKSARTADAVIVQPIAEWPER